MNELHVSSVDANTIIAVDGEGEEFRVPVDEATLARLKRNTSSESGPRVSPREIQTQLRSGLSAAEVSALTGASLEQIERYAAPILAEREYVVTAAQTFPAFSHIEHTQDATLFGELIDERLALVDAREVSWTAWKNDGGEWILKLTFVSSGAERDARWTFDGKRQSVNPHNDEAARLSHAGTFDTSALVPSLRAVTGSIPIVSETPATAVLFDIDEGAEILTDSVATDSSAGEEGHTGSTEDLLEALRRRRRESESAPAWLREDVAARTAPVEEIFQDSLDVSDGLFDSAEFDQSDSGSVFPLNTSSHKRNRPAMPSWEEIVSETKSDDDLL